MQKKHAPHGIVLLIITWLLCITWWILQITFEAWSIVIIIKKGNHITKQLAGICIDKIRIDKVIREMRNYSKTLYVWIKLNTKHNSVTTFTSGDIQCMCKFLLLRRMGFCWRVQGTILKWTSGVGDLDEGFCWLDFGDSHPKWHLPLTQPLVDSENAQLKALTQESNALLANSSLYGV